MASSPVRGRPGTTLSDVTPSALEPVARALGRWSCTTRWSSRGHAPSPAMLDALLWEGVPLQQVATTASGDVVALLQLVSVNLDSGYGFLELIADPGRTGEWDAALPAFLDRAFAELPLRKVCLAAVADELVLPPSLRPVARHAGALRRHERRSEAVYVDVDFYEVWLEDWRRRSGRG